MATEFSDIYIDGINTEEIYANGGRIVEAWLDGECVWKLKDETLTVKEIYHVVYHDEMYYVIFRAGILLHASPNGMSSWENLSYYIGTGNTLGIVTKTNKLDKYNNYDMAEFIAAECPNGLFIYRSAAYEVGTQYIYFENYNIYAPKSIILENPFGNNSQTLLTHDLGMWCNAVITNKYIFYYGGDSSGRRSLRITDFEHKEIKRITEDTDPGDGPQFIYISANGGNKIYFHYPYESDAYLLKYGIIDIDSLEYRQGIFNFEPISQKMMDDVFDDSDYEKPNLSEVNSDITVYRIWALSAGKYLSINALYGVKCLNKKSQQEEWVRWGNDCLINIDNGTYQYTENGRSFLFDLGKGYMITTIDRIVTLSYTWRPIFNEWPFGNKFPTINSLFNYGFYVYRNANPSYIFGYDRTSCQFSEYPETTIIEEE